jgi:hypothetical protein
MGSLTMKEDRVEGPWVDRCSISVFEDGCIIIIQNSAGILFNISNNQAT